MDRLEQIIESDPAQYAIWAALTLAVVLVSTEQIAAETVITLANVLGIGVVIGLNVFSPVTISDAIEAIFNEDTLPLLIQSALFDRHGIKLSYTQTGIATFYDFGFPLYLNIEDWNPSQGIERYSDIGEFGTLRFFHVNDLD